MSGRRSRTFGLNLTKVATMRGAISRQDDEADFVTIVASNGLAATCNDYLTKGASSGTVWAETVSRGIFLPDGRARSDGLTMSARGH